MQGNAFKSASCEVQEKLIRHTQSCEQKAVQNLQGKDQHASRRHGSSPVGQAPNKTKM